MRIENSKLATVKALQSIGYDTIASGDSYNDTKRREWYKNKLISVFGGVHIDEIDGYYVFTVSEHG